YAREGAKVFICARENTDLKKAVAEIRSVGGEVSWCAADISKVREVKRIVRAVRRAYGTIHVLVNNASILGPREPIVRYPLSSWEEVVKVNLTALFLVTREVLKIMIPQKEGSIINLSSGVGRVGKARWGAYAASKFGVEGFTQVLADEVKEWNIRVNAVNPGGTRTEMRAEAYPDEEPLTLPAPGGIGMKNSYWITIAAAALVVGVLLGYGIWGPNAARLPEVEKELTAAQAKIAETEKKTGALESNLGKVANEKLNLEKEIAELKEALEKAAKKKGR
ncbi:MAG: SDR family NAD(P)-dependent oxidoreductase, partial [Deltaproteobacteria bacterium]|nr:SDR family NAD(P)-dependent oxidoreductase [Deltaproteobacteria bacterium]